MKVSILSIVVVTTAVAADLHSVNSLRNIMGAAVDYHKVVSDFDGSYYSGISLWRSSGLLAKRLRAAGVDPTTPDNKRYTIEEDEQLEQEAFNIAHSLLGEVRRTVDAALDKKELFDGIPLGKSIALRRVNEMQDAASYLGSVLVPKSREGRQAESLGLVQQIHDEFQRSKSAFEKP